MKRIKCVLAAMLAFCILCGLLSGCSKPEGAQAHNEERLKYDFTEALLINLYKGELYAIGLPQGTETETGTKVEVFSENGEKKRELFLEGIDVYPSCWDIFDDAIYFVTEIYTRSEETKQWENRCALYSADIESGKSQELYEFSGFSSIKKIRASDDGMIYCFGTKQSYDSYSDTLFLDNGEIIDYSYSGEVFGYYDRDKGEYIESELAYPVAFGERDGNVIVYAFEEEVGYYFHDYKSKTDNYTNKLKKIEDIELINDNKDYVFAGVEAGCTGTLAVSGISDESGIIQIDDNLTFSSCGTVCTEGDYVCVSALEDVYSFEHNVFKYYTANVSTSNPPVKIISSSYFEPLFSCGSQIRNQQLTRDGFALTVLSLDRDYDLAMLNTSEIYANDVKEKGSFYPLNDIPGVAEYMESCFPYVKEAATNDNGEIWMLPVSLDVDVMIYNEKNCADSDITFPRELEPFLQQMRKGAEVSKYYDCSRYRVVKTMLRSYLSLNNSFDTDSFRSYAPLLKGMYGDEVFEPRADVNVNLALSSKQTNDKLGISDIYSDAVYKKALFTTDSSSSGQCLLIGDENLLAASMPYAKGAKSSAVCSFICVNPSSEHLEETLLFIERLVSYLSRKQNSLIFKDKDTYSSDRFTQSLYEVYENSQIYFEIPPEVYYNDFENYCAGDITLDQFIDEADRKLSAYLNE